MIHLLLDIYEERSVKGKSLILKVGETDKETAHETYLLHKSVHLLVLSHDLILCRLRGVNEARYSALWTSSFGTHVLSGEDYLSTLRMNGFDEDLNFSGEFRIDDTIENEICGLFLLNVEKNYSKLNNGHQFLDLKTLERRIKEGKTTPHLEQSYKLWKRHGN